MALGVIVGIRLVSCWTIGAWLGAGLSLQLVGLGWVCAQNTVLLPPLRAADASSVPSESNVSEDDFPPPPAPPRLMRLFLGDETRRAPGRRFSISLDAPAFANLAVEGAKPLGRKIRTSLDLGEEPAGESLAPAPGEDVAKANSSERELVRIGASSVARFPELDSDPSVMSLGHVQVRSSLTLESMPAPRAVRRDLDVETAVDYRRWFRTSLE
ncbi:MAG TPA: hypothetical protein VFQ61_35060 [Polyangiaceae bacterium]|nr:hypothetical protein [Polyangiaceae bacterium]